jgi:hypothetical protein
MELYGWLKNQWDRALAGLATVAGVVFLILGWAGASGKSLVTEQIPYLASGAVAGLFALGAAATLWLSADLRDEWRKLDEIYRFMSEAEQSSGLVESEAMAEPTTELADAPPGGRRRRGRGPRLASSER